MAFQHGFDRSEPLRARPISAPAGAYEDRRSSRVWRLATGTLACPRCDVPLALGGRAVRFSEDLDCPFCRHSAPLRDFLSLAAPARPNRVEVRMTQRARDASR